MRLKDRIVLVTGGGRAIGRCIALRAAEEGADVAVLGPEEPPLEQVACEIRALGRRAAAVLADVSQEEQVTAAFQKTQSELGPLDVLVNNAGIIGPTAPVYQVRREDWDQTLAVNLTGAYLCAKAALPAMITRRAGKIINIASIAGKLAYPLRAPYAVSKWGLIGLTLTLAKEVGTHDIEVNAVCPGPIEGERMCGIIATRAQELGKTVEEVTREYRKTTLLGRMVSQEDVAAMVVFLASSEGDNITGQAIDVSAGYGL